MNDPVEPALAKALERLVGQGTLTLDQADAVRSGFETAARDDHPTDRTGGGRTRAGTTRVAGAGDRSWSPVLAEVGGYIGAAFVVAAAIALVGPGWDEFTRVGRIGLLAGPAVLLLLAAVAVAAAVPGGWSIRPTGDPQGAPGARRRLVGALVLAAGGLLAGAAVVVTDDPEAYRWVSLVPLTVWGIGYVLCRGVPLHLGTASALTWTALSVLDVDMDERWAAGALLLVIAGVAWGVLANLGLVEEQALGFAVAGVMAFIGGETAVGAHAWLGYLLLGLLAAAGLGVYLHSRVLTALGVGAVALAVVVPQAVIDYTEGSLGAAGGLLVSGLTVVGVSVLAARVRRSSGPAELV